MSERIAGALKSLNLPVSISHEILPEYREYERTSTVVVNAYLQPLMGRYLNRLVTHASGVQSRDACVPKLRVMQSSGGSISAHVAASEPVRTILSGPAGGVVGALRIASAVGIQNVITFDMGGTSTDVALCDRDGMRLTNESIVAGCRGYSDDGHSHCRRGWRLSAQVDEGGRCASGLSRRRQSRSSLLWTIFCRQ
jgi:N-methylhydantoinase A